MNQARHWPDETSLGVDDVPTFKIYLFYQLWGLGDASKL
jgi:hypothetical protein